MVVLNAKILALDAQVFLHFEGNFTAEGRRKTLRLLYISVEFWKNWSFAQKRTRKGEGICEEDKFLSANKYTMSDRISGTAFAYI